MFASYFLLVLVPIFACKAISYCIHCNLGRDGIVPARSAGGRSAVDSHFLPSVVPSHAMEAIEAVVVGPATSSTVR